MDQLLGLADRQRTKHHRVDQRKDRGVRPYPKGQRENGSGGEAGRAAHLAQRVAEVLGHVGEQTPTEGIAIFLARLVEPAQRHQRLPARFLRRHPAGPVRFGLLLDVEAQFLIQLATRLLAAPPCPRALHEFANHVLMLRPTPSGPARPTFDFTAPFRIFWLSEILTSGKRAKMPTQAKARLVKPLAKGQITLPVAFRRQLGIDATTILQVALREGKIEISPWRPPAREEQLREYSSAKIRQFLKDDRLDAKTAARVRRLLARKSAR